jgi:hypothetical protein
MDLTGLILQTFVTGRDLTDLTDQVLIDLILQIVAMLQMLRDEIRQILRTGQIFLTLLTDLMHLILQTCVTGQICQMSLTEMFLTCQILPTDPTDQTEIDLIFLTGMWLTNQMLHIHQTGQTALTEICQMGVIDQMLQTETHLTHQTLLTG